MPGQPIPLVFGFHGATGNGAQADSWGVHTAAFAAGDSAIFFYPDGLDQGGETGWDEDENGEDVALFDALLAYAEANFCVDTHRVFLVGFSWGGDFSNTLSCYRGDKIRAINTFSCGFYNSGCVSQVPAYRETYSSPNGTDFYSQADIDAAIGYYVTAQGCSSSTQATSPSPCLAYQGCSVPVVYCAYPNMGHAVPSLNNNAHTDGAADAWAFLSSFH